MISKLWVLKGFHLLIKVNNLCRTSMICDVRATVVCMTVVTEGKCMRFSRYQKKAGYLCQHRNFLLTEANVEEVL